MYYKACEYFGKGKYWELGIHLLQRLRKEKAHYIKTAEQIQEIEKNYYTQIKQKDRFFEQYFYVEFHGDFPPKFKV